MLPDMPDENLETLYATVSGIICVFGAVWYLLFVRPDVLDALWSGLREDLGAIRRAARADFHEARNLICGAEEEVDKLRTCTLCGKDFEHGVIIDDDDYCAQCSLSPEIFRKAQEGYMNMNKEK